MLLRSFQATSRGYVTELDDEVALILGQLLGETITVLDAPSEQSFLSAITVDERRDEPDDPTLRILLPSMSADPDEAQTLRAMTEDTLRTEKSERLIAIKTALADIATGASNTIVVPAEHVWAWLSGLNDLRLVLAQRLGVESSDQTEIWYQRVNAIFEGAAGDGEEMSPQHALPNDDETGPLQGAGGYDETGPLQDAGGQDETGPQHALLHEKNAEGGADNNPLVLTREELVALVFVLVSWWQDSLLEAVQSEGAQSTL